METKNLKAKVGIRWAQCLISVAINKSNFKSSWYWHWTTTRRSTTGNCTLTGSPKFTTSALVSAWKTTRTTSVSWGMWRKYVVATAFASTTRSTNCTTRLRVESLQLTAKIRTLTKTSLCRWRRKMLVLKWWSRTWNLRRELWEASSFDY
jgi:hypothetical protein